MAIDYGLHQYPTDPMPAVKVLLSYYRDDTKPPVMEVAHSAWHLAGFGMKQFDPHPPIYASVGAMNKERVTQQLEAIEASHNTQGTFVSAIDWAGLVKVLLELALKLFMGM